MTAVVNYAGEQVFPATGERLDSLFSRLILTWTSRLWGLLWWREARGWQRRLVIRMRRGTRAVVVMAAGSTKGLGEDVRDGRQSVVCLCCGHVVDVGGLRQV